MPEFWWTVLVNALGTIVGGFVLAAITGLLVDWAAHAAALTSTQVDHKLRTAKRSLHYSVAGIVFGLVGFPVVAFVFVDEGRLFLPAGVTGVAAVCALWWLVYPPALRVAR